MLAVRAAPPSYSGPEDVRCCYCYRTEHCDTSEAAWLIFSRTNSSFNYQGLCALMHMSPHVKLWVCAHVKLGRFCSASFFLYRTKFRNWAKKVKLFFLKSQEEQSVSVLKCHNVPETLFTIFCWLLIDRNTESVTVSVHYWHLFLLSALWRMSAACKDSWPKRKTPGFHLNFDPFHWFLSFPPSQVSCVGQITSF